MTWPGGQLRADGGTPFGPLFTALDQPVLAYEMESAPRVRAVNAAFCDTEGASAVERGMLVSEGLAAIGVDEAVARAIERAADRGERVERTAKLDASRCDRASIRVVPAEGAQAVAGFVLIESVDVDARADRLETFARAVSHDLRNPLDVARIRLDAAENSGDAVHFEKVRDAHDRIRRIASDVLFLTEPGAAIDTDPVDLEAIVGDAWETVDTGEATLVVEDATAVAADEAHLQRLFENLFRNAVEHAGPRVTVTVGTATDGFYVADDGPGIDREARDRLFEPGQSDNGGTGLGLAVVLQIAQAHGWAVRPGESEAGGARFTFADVDHVDDAS